MALNPFDCVIEKFRGSPVYRNGALVPGDLEWQGEAGAAVLTLQMLKANYSTGYTTGSPIRYVYDQLVALEKSLGRNSTIDFLKEMLNREANQ